MFQIYFQLASISKNRSSNFRGSTVHRLLIKSTFGQAHELFVLMA